MIPKPECSEFRLASYPEVKKSFVKGQFLTLFHDFQQDYLQFLHTNLSETGKFGIGVEHCISISYFTGKVTIFGRQFVTSR